MSATSPGHAIESCLVLVAGALLVSFPAQAAGDARFTLDFRGQERSYLVHSPPRPRSPAPVILSFHGGGGNAPAQQEYSRLDAVADREGFIVVYPNGTGI